MSAAASSVVRAAKLVFVSRVSGFELEVHLENGTEGTFDLPYPVARDLMESGHLAMEQSLASAKGMRPVQERVL